MKQLQTATRNVPSLPVEDPVTATGQKQTFKIRKKTRSSTKQKMGTDTLQRKRAHLVQSINQFHKANSLRKTVTRDRSIPNFDEHIVHQMQIRHFDKSKLKHVEPAKEMGDYTNNNGKPANYNCGCEDDMVEIARRTKLMHRSNTVNVACALERSEDDSDSIDIFDCTDPCSPLSEHSYDDFVNTDTEHAEAHRRCSLDLEFTLAVLDIEAEPKCQDSTQEDAVQSLDCN